MNNEKPKKKLGPISGMKSEIKKVSFPSLSKTLKQTSIVIAVVLLFSAIIFAFDWLLKIAYDWLIL